MLAGWHHPCGAPETSRTARRAHELLTNSELPAVGHAGRLRGKTGALEWGEVAAFLFL